MRFLTLLLLCLPFLALSQNKKIIDHSDVHRWKKIEQSRVSGNGNWVAWQQSPVSEGDATVHLWNSQSGNTVVFERASEPKLSEDSEWLFFRIKPSLDTLKAMRRRKVKEDDLPKDTLAIYRLSDGSMQKIARLRNFTVPEKWSGWLLYQVETEKPAPAPKDTSSKKEKPAERKGGKKPKKEDKDNGFRLITHNLATGKPDTFAYVKDYAISRKGKRVIIGTTGKGDTLTFGCNQTCLQNGIYQVDLDKNIIKPLWRGKGKFSQLSLDDTGMQAAFLLDTDTTKARIRPWQVWYYQSGADSASFVADATTRIPGIQPGWVISEHAKPTFPENGSRLYFGFAPPPVLNDTTLLPEEIVSVEVWSWTENRLYTQQEVLMDAEKKRSYTIAWYPGKNRFVQLSSPDIPEVRFQEQRDASLALGFTEEPYAKLISWEGVAHKDIYAIDQNTGDKTLIIKDVRCNPRVSPSGRYIYWWSDMDTAWYAWSSSAGILKKLTDNRTVPFYDVENDIPDYPNEYGLAGWLDNDEAMLVYDQFDIWNIDPAGKRKPVKITNGRAFQITHRYIKLDPEERSIRSDSKVFIHQSVESTKNTGYAWLDLKTATVTPLFRGNTTVNKNPLKARDKNCLVFTRENYQVFPDLLYISDAGNYELNSEKRVSNANPQQSEYNWGSIELVEWTSLTGEKLRGLLVKPDGFDPAKQYPMIVNFYERVSDGLHTHRSPDFPRSQVNFTIYASKGYLIFNPDITYKTGYPGESAYDAIVSGVTALMNKGFVDPKRIALQGHSWGGYQAAYLITRTNMFACAEAGAPVVNMTSAYGGIRWESGLSRAFQYEHTQSRIGGTLWEYPDRYRENSPLFSFDKVNTPVLILHNDKDGAVPWYQGIEMYSALRRLGKPAWMLNYNDEPHWPVKLQNRMDFQRRMQQFFDHYLMDAPIPSWMEKGVSPIEKGIRQGFETETGN